MKIINLHLVLLFYYILYLILQYCVNSLEIKWKNYIYNGNYTVLSGNQLILSGTVRILGELKIQSGGIVRFLDAPTNLVTKLYVTNIENYGEFYIGTLEKPYNNQAIIELTCLNNKLYFIDLVDDRRKGINNREGSIFSVIGKNNYIPYTKLNKTANKGDLFITVLNNNNNNNNLNIKIGDEIIISSTDFDPNQTEKKKIINIINERYYLDSSLEYMHFGQMTEGIDQRAEILILNKNIQFIGCQEKLINYKSIGGHIKNHINFKLFQVQDISISNFGQGDTIGRYPIHFHLCERVPNNTFFRFSIIKSSNFRAIVIHGSQGVLIHGNGFYNITGHAVMLEDGAEYDNIFTKNAILLVKEKLSGAYLGSDARTGLAGFYITNPNNIFNDNIIGGVEGTGFWLHVRLSVKGLSYLSKKYSNLIPYQENLKECIGNTVHSVQYGFKISSDNFDLFDSPQQTYYSPSYTYLPLEIPIIEKFTVYHSRHGGWFRSYDIILNEWMISDVSEGIQILSQGNTAKRETNTNILNSIFIGTSSNRGNPTLDNEWQRINTIEKRSDSAIERSDDGRVGMMLYDGPTVLKNCTFLYWYSQDCLNYYNPALGARLYNTFMMSTKSFVSDLTFISTDYRFHISDRTGDGGKTTSIMDITGSISGHIGAIILPDWDFYYTEGCERNALFELACPHSYANLEVVHIDNDSNPNKYGDLIISRNNFDIMDNNNIILNKLNMIFNGQYIPESNGWLYHPSISNGASYLLNFNKNTPSTLRFVLVNAKKDNIFYLNIIYPLGTIIRSIKDRSEVNIISESRFIDVFRNVNTYHSYFYDTKRGLLSIRMVQIQDEISYSLPCPAIGCERITIETILPFDLNTGISLQDAQNRAYNIQPSLQISSNSNDKRFDPSIKNWLQIKFLHESAFILDKPLNIDWCKGSGNNTCLKYVSSGDRRVGILAYSDPQCAITGGNGCFRSTCRYCKLDIAASTIGFVLCPFQPNETIVDDRLTNNKNISITVVPATAPSINKSVSPLTSDPKTIISKPSITATPSVTINDGQKCITLVSSGDISVGISSYFDSTCMVGGIGCFNQVCRYCKTRETLQSNSLLSCNRSMSKSISTIISNNILESAVADIQITNDSDNHSICSNKITNEHLSIGLFSFYDQTCIHGGIGCFTDNCRFCKKNESSQLSNLYSCPNVPVSKTNASFTEVVGSSDIIKNHNLCSRLVSYNDKLVGILGMYDPICIFGGIGCFNNFCKFCKIKESNQSISFVICPSYLSLSISTFSTLNETVISNKNLNNVSCTSYVSSGDQSIFLSASYDSLCQIFGGFGCFANHLPCRYCKIKSISENRFYNFCSQQTSEFVSVSNLRLPLSTQEVNCVEEIKKFKPFNVSAINDIRCFTSQETNSIDCLGNNIPCRFCRENGNGTNDTWYLYNCNNFNNFYLQDNLDISPTQWNMRKNETVTDSFLKSKIFKFNGIYLLAICVLLIGITTFGLRFISKKLHGIKFNLDYLKKEVMDEELKILHYDNENQNEKN